MLSYQKTLRLFVATLIAVITLVCVLNAAAQSGRRTRKPPAPIPVATEEPTPAKAVEKPTPEVTLIVGMERYDNFGLNVNNPGTILMALCDRLDDNPAVKVEQVRRDFNRSEAVRRAKAEEAAYVVLLELEAESRTAVNVKVNEVSIQYTVFSPVTAKLKAFGRTYPQAARSGGVILSPGRNVYGDYQLQQAARHAAEKILEAFDLSRGGTGPLAMQN